MEVLNGRNKKGSGHFENTATDTGSSTSKETNATEVATEQPFKVFQQ